MIIAAWVGLVLFSFISVPMLIKFFRLSVNKLEAILMVISFIVTAMCAGIIWGGLFH
jgi:hypothetical protein